MKDEDLFSFKELQARYHALLAENRLLKEEINTLKSRFSVAETDLADDQYSSHVPEQESIVKESSSEPSCSGITKDSKSAEKIRYFMSLFRGREDVHARRWESKKKVGSGYSPVCLNEWKHGLCGKPKMACSKCSNKLYALLDERVVDDHLRGGMVAGIYPITKRGNGDKTDGRNSEAYF